MTSTAQLCTWGRAHHGAGFGLVMCPSLPRSGGRAAVKWPPLRQPLASPGQCQGSGYALATSIAVASSALADFI